MEILQRYHIDIRLFGKHPRVCGELSYITGAICDFAVWSHQQPRRHQSGQETPLCANRQVDRKYSTNESSPCMVIAGHKRQLQALIFHALVNGAGRERSHAARKPTGPHCQKQRWPVENVWGVVARKVAKRIANAQRLFCSTELYVKVVDNALRRIFHGKTALNSMLSMLSITCNFYSW